jgi:hypothetical protein
LDESTEHVNGFKRFTDDQTMVLLGQSDGIASDINDLRRAPALSRSQPWLRARFRPKAQI